MKLPTIPPTEPLGTAARLQERARKPHVIGDRTSRVFKAQKIVAIIGLRRFLRCRRILEVGCGSGLIASTLAGMGSSDLMVDAVDVVDNRVEKDGYTFRLVQGTSLPFGDDTFDLVITNHVIEHVGDKQAQLAHLAEVMRVTADNGTIYFAAPNKWRVVEPHYRLPLLSWFPASVSDAYVRLARRAEYYDCFPRSRRQYVHLFKTTGLAYGDRTIAALRQTLALEHRGHLATKIVNTACPDWLLALGRPVVPTLIFLLHKGS